MEVTHFLDPKNNFAFIQIFRREKNKDILIHFLNDILGYIGEEKIKEVTFLKTNQDPDIAAYRQFKVTYYFDQIRKNYPLSG